MAVDTPARIAVLGAGPIGLEAALYARFLGYDADIYERGRVAQHVRRWGHVRMFSPFLMNRSTLALAALAAQDSSYRVPDDEALLTGNQWADHYLVPLSQTDLLADHLHEQTEVLAVSREGLLKGDLIGQEERAEQPFRLLLRHGDGSQQIRTADIVIDATGVYSHPNAIGSGGIPAIGEMALREQIEYWIPDVLGAQRSRYAGKRTLVVGRGYSAATTVVALAELARQSSGTSAVWVTRRALPADADGPLELMADDPLPERVRITAEANRCVRDNPQLEHWPETQVEQVVYQSAEQRLQVRFSGAHAGLHQFDRIVSLTGFRPDHSIHQELQAQFCYATDGLMKLAAALLKEDAVGRPSPSAPQADCLKQPAPGPQALLHPEPNFYTLGAKSYGRNPHFLYSTGLTQIRDIFTIIGDRAELDLYSSVLNLLP